jgi:hypothetical protein
MLRSTLVVSEIALALVLLTGAGLMLKSFMRMRAVDPGFRTENVLTMTVDLPDASYPTVTAIQAFDSSILTKLSNLPGVVAAGAVNFMPLQPVLISGDFTLDGGRKLPRDYNVANPLHARSGPTRTRSDSASPWKTSPNRRTGLPSLELSTTSGSV